MPFSVSLEFSIQTSTCPSHPIGPRQNAPLQTSRNYPTKNIKKNNSLTRFFLFLPGPTGTNPTANQRGKKKTSTSPLSELHALKSKEDPKSNKVNCRRQVAEMVGNQWKSPFPSIYSKFLVIFWGVQASLLEKLPILFSYCVGRQY